MKIFYIWGRGHHGLHNNMKILEKDQVRVSLDGHRWTKKNVV